MKRMKNNYLLGMLVMVAGLMAAVGMLFPVMAFARQDTFRELPEAVSVSQDYVIHIPFEDRIHAASVSRANIYVMDSGNQKVGISRAVSSDGKTIVVTPLKAYRPGESYTLYIKKSMKYASGKTLSEGLRKQFTVTKAVEKLPVVGTREKLLEILEKAQLQYGGINYGLRKGNIVTFEFSEALGGAPAAADVNTESAAAPAAPAAQKAAQDGSADFSATNVQVQGVDEADIVKTDGKYIYQVSSDRIVISAVYPTDKMKVQKVLPMEEEKIYPTELYLDEKYLVVLGASQNDVPVYRSQAPSLRKMPPLRYSSETVKMLVYDISDKAAVKKTREIELEGGYLSSRKIGSMLYLVSNKYVHYYHIMQNEAGSDTPAYRDTAVSEDFRSIGYDRIAYFPDSLEPNYMVVAGVNLDMPKQEVNVSTYLGSGESIYASQDNLYVAVTKHTFVEHGPVIFDSAASKPIMPAHNDKSTMLYRFALNDGKLEYTGKGQVPGSILNQFSMDESSGFFRIATTTGEMWRDDAFTSKNNVYVLDSSLSVTGKLEDIAPGEKIYSVRFMGHRAYMVTFRTVDPLFVLDLKDPKNPQVLGALKIPGYSDYLHPYDENHIIGFGKDAVEIVRKDEKGNEIFRNAYYLGMKMAIFDVSDVKNPKEKYSEKIGDRGTDSELLRNHKALLFSKEKNLLAFPVTLMEVMDQEKFEANGMPAYGSFSFQGAYVYGIDLEKGFRLRGRITHISEDEYMKAGDRWYDSNKSIQRILYIDDSLYTVSNSRIKAHGIHDLKEKGSLELQ